MIALPSMFTALLTSGAFYFLAPYVFVVNSVPWTAPPSAAEVAEVLQHVQVPRFQMDFPNPAPAILRTANLDTGSWQDTGKGHAPRVLLSKLSLGQDLPEVNAYLQSIQPWSVPGSSWEMNNGDYDFTETILVQILYLFGGKPDRLYPETTRHLVNDLLVNDGGHPTLTVPLTFGLIFDTENHILMTESSRYLKNQWLFTHGATDKKYDNTRNGLQEWFMGRLNHIRVHGFHEFNSVPYETYGIIPLLNLDAFAQSPELAALARTIVDAAVWRHALSSVDFRACIPFRRQPQYAGDTNIAFYSINERVQSWTAPESNDGRLDHSMDAALLPYRPPAEAVAWFKEKPREYFVRIGHGPYGSPEILSGGPGYVLSAGGACPDAESQVVPRPTALLLSDGAADLNACFHIAGAGAWTAWNNTGVHQRFACGNQPVHLPAQYSPAAESDGWKIFTLGAPARLLLATWSSEDFGLMALFPDQASNPNELLQSLRAANPDAQTLRQSFRWPGGNTLSYEVNAPYGTWVMANAGGQALDRNCGAWPLFTE